MAKWYRHQRRGPAAGGRRLLVVAALLLLAGAVGGRRRGKAKGGGARARPVSHPPPQPTTTGDDVTSAESLAARAAGLARDGTLPVRYSGEIQASNGELFATPLELEPCAGGWRCARRARANHWELQARGDDTAFCDVAVVSADELTAAAFAQHYENKQPVLIRQAGSGRAPFMTQAIRELFSREGLLSGFGPHPASVGTSLEIVHKSGTGAKDMNIGEFVNTLMGAGAQSQTMGGEPLYIFQRGVLGTDIVTPSIEGIFDPEHTVSPALGFD